jgi:hypothetical protein
VVNALVQDEDRDRDEASTDKFAEREGEMAPKVETKRPPRAEEVGPPPGVQWKSTDPLPGLPFDTSFDSEGWIDEGPGQTQNGDLNIAGNPTTHHPPDHPTAGCVTAVVPHPTNQNIIYIGTANGGVWKTTNALDPEPRWKALTDNQLSMSIGGMAMDRNDATGNTLVAGYGRRSSFGSNAGGAQKGLIRTTDGGTTWTRIELPVLNGRSIYQMAVNGNMWLLAVPSTDNMTVPGLYQTTDGGASFANLFVGGNACTHLAADPSNAARYYCHIKNSGVYRSTDSGATWTIVNTPNGSTRTVALTVSPNGTVFAAELASPEHVYRSTNQGGTWVPLDDVTANTGDTFNGFVADPSNSNLVYLSGLFTRCCFPFSGRVVRGNAALAAGSQWTPIASTQLQPGSTPDPNCNPGNPCNSAANGGTAPHTDSRAMAFTAGNRLIEGDDGGIYELSVANLGSEGDGANGNTWRSLNGNLHVSEMHSMAYDRVARIVIGGAQDTGFQEQLVSGEKLWDKTSNGDGGDAAIDFIATPGQAIRYGSSQQLGGFYRRTVNDHNVQTAFAYPGLAGLTGSPQFVSPLATNAVAGSRLIVSTNTRVFESTDQGDTVTQVDTVKANQIAKIAYGGRFGGSDAPEVLFFGSGSNIRYRTAAGSITNNIVFPGGTVQGIVLDPQNWKHVWVIGNTSVYFANDITTGTFANLTGNLTGVGTMHTIEYLTLPGAAGIVVGTDVGAYFMNNASPGTWTTLGNNLPHVPVYDSHFDVAGQVLAVSCFGRGTWLYDFKPNKATGQYGETFQSYVTGTTTFPARVGELYSNQVGTAQIMDSDMHELQLTANGLGGTRSVFRLPDLNPGTQVRGFSAKWNSQIYGSASTLGEGFSFNFGPLGGIAGSTLAGATYSQEDGFNAGLTVSVRTNAGNAPGYYVRVNGTTVTGGFVSKPASDWGSFALTRHFFEMDWQMDTGLTLSVDGVAIFTNLATPGFVPATGDRVVWGARTGGVASEEMRLDNLVVFSGGVLSRVMGIAPFYKSGDYPQAGQTADKAFDENVNTKWLTLDYTGYIGASFPAATTVRAYTLISSEDVPGRDLASWDFQTGNDGTLWTQHGAQSAQGFLNRGERRAFVVANPVANTKFRVLISENHEAAEIQLSEFQPWELKTIPPVPTAIVSSKTHGGAGTFSINLPLTGSLGIECRSGGASNDYQLVFTFPSAVTFTSAIVSSGVGSVSGTSGSGTTTISVNLTGVTNAQRITVTLLGATDGANTGDLSVQMGVLVGDTSGNGSVTGTDVSQTKLQSGQPVSGSNFRSDVIVSGSINGTDVSSVKLRSGTALPP